MTNRRRVRVGSVLVCCLLAAACSEPEPSDPPRRLQLDFDDIDTRSLAPGQTALQASGGQPVEGDVLSTGGPVPLGAGVDGGRALVLPPAPRQVAALKVVLPDPDAFSPGDGDLTLGADVAWDGVSHGEDSGANVVQRGLFTDTGQYKLQVDSGVPSCRVEGSKGEVLVKAEESLSRGSWYRLECRRRGDEVMLDVQSWDGGEWAEPERSTGTGAIGAVDIAATTPLSVGAKLSAAGTLVPSRPDQFHGAIDRVVVEAG